MDTNSPRVGEEVQRFLLLAGEEEEAERRSFA